MKEKGNSRNIVFVLLFIFIVYCPLLLIATDHFSSAVALNGDLSLYAENILKFQYGVVYQDITYALSHTTYGYGDFFFLILNFIFIFSYSRLSLSLSLCTHTHTPVCVCVCVCVC